MILHPSIADIAARRIRVDKALRAGSLSAKDGAALIEQYAYIYKDGGPVPMLAMGRGGAAESNLADDNTYSIPFTITHLEEDRDGDIVIPMGCQLGNYSRNPVVFFGHQSWEVPIGRCKSPDGRITVYPEENRVRAVIYYDRADPDAMLIYGKTKRGYLNAVSVAFVPIEAYRRDQEEKWYGEDNNKARTHSRPMMPPGWLFKTWDMTELSEVGVPSNPQAVAEQKGIMRDIFDRERSDMSPRLRKAWGSYCAAAKGCWHGWCPCLPGEEKGKTMRYVWSVTGYGPLIPGDKSGNREGFKRVDIIADTKEDALRIGLGELPSNRREQPKVRLIVQVNPDSNSVGPVKSISKQLYKVGESVRITGGPSKNEHGIITRLEPGKTCVKLDFGGDEVCVPTAWVAYKEDSAEVEEKARDRSQLRRLQDRLLATGRVQQFVLEHSEEYPLWEGGPSVRDLRQFIYPEWENEIERYARQFRAVKSKLAGSAIMTVKGKHCCAECKSGKPCKCVGVKKGRKFSDIKLTSLPPGVRRVKIEGSNYSGYDVKDITTGERLAPTFRNRRAAGRWVEERRHRLVKSFGGLVEKDIIVLEAGNRLAFMREVSSWNSSHVDKITVSGSELLSSGKYRMTLNGPVDPVNNLRARFHTDTKSLRKFATQADIEGPVQPPGGRTNTPQQVKTITERDGKYWVQFADGTERGPFASEEEAMAVHRQPNISAKAIKAMLLSIGQRVSVHDRDAVITGISNDGETARIRFDDTGREINVVAAILSMNTGGMRKTQPSSDIDSSKACKILEDGEINGKPLTEAQRGLFGAACGRKKQLSESSGTTGGYIVPAKADTTCPGCLGTGNCEVCEGKGEIGDAECAECGGSGDCPQCGGGGVLKAVVKALKVEQFPNGMWGVTSGVTHSGMPKLAAGPFQTRSKAENAKSNLESKGNPMQKGKRKTTRRKAEEVTEAGTREDSPEVEKEPFTPKPSAQVLASLYSHAKAEQDYLDGELAKMDHPGVTAALKEYSEDHPGGPTKRMQHYKDILDEHHGDHKEHFDDMVKALETSGADNIETGEANLVDAGLVPKSEDRDTAVEPPALFNKGYRYKAEAFAGEETPEEEALEHEELGKDDDLAITSCPSCGALVRPNEDGTCPECGEVVKDLTNEGNPAELKEGEELEPQDEGAAPYNKDIVENPEDEGAAPYNKGEDPDTEEILERYQHPKSKRWLVRRVGMVRYTKEGRAYLVRRRKDLTNEGNPAELAPGEHGPGEGQIIMAISPEHEEVVTKAADHMEALTEAPDIPKYHHAGLSYHSSALRKMRKELTNPGKTQETGGAGSELSNEGNPAELKGGDKEKCGYPDKGKGIKELSPAVLQRWDGLERRLGQFGIKLSEN